eukprot:7456141-Pyramimonas_sp.AAC.1
MFWWVHRFVVRILEPISGALQRIGATCRSYLNSDCDLLTNSHARYWRRRSRAAAAAVPPAPARPAGGAHVPAGAGGDARGHSRSHGRAPHPARQVRWIRLRDRWGRTERLA